MDICFTSAQTLLGRAKAAKVTGGPKQQGSGVPSRQDTYRIARICAGVN